MSTSRLLVLAARQPADASRLAVEIAALDPGLRVIAYDPAEFPRLVREGLAPWLFVDWLLPDMSGLELCRRAREAAPPGTAHITLVIEDAEGDCRRRALAAGADDYMVGTLDAPALVARAAGPVAASTGAPQRGVHLRHGLLTVDRAAFQARYDGRLLVLRPNEFRLLYHFVEHPDQVFSREALIGSLGKQEEATDERTVDVWVGRLRRALRAQGVPDPLRTVRSYGYVLDSAG